MVLQVYNTLSGKKERFIPLKEGQVRIYVCGLTVQNYSHLGHIRSALDYDLIRRYLEYKGYEVVYVQNFTDINEKIIARAEEEGLTPAGLAAKYTRAYLEDIQKMNIKPATHYSTATENIEEIIDMVKKLIERGYAYEVNGNVYFSIEKFEDYGKLSGRSLDEMEAGARIELNEEKRNPLDFALWKKVEGEEVSWASPWGRGWPGWHIECSAMSIKYLGESFDIHGGGSDLIFPHHENEIAQSEACTGKPFARYWLHNGTVNLKGEKMSKSLGNFFTTRELLQEYEPAVLRYYILTKHYRTPINFDLEDLKNAGTSLDRLKETWGKLKRVLELKGPAGNEENNGNKDNSGNKDNTVNEDITGKRDGYPGDNIAAPGVALEKAREGFMEGMDDDFNSARAIGVLHQLATEVNTYLNKLGGSGPAVSAPKIDGSSRKILEKTGAFFEEAAGILGIELTAADKDLSQPGLEEELIEFILELREDARERKDYQLADQIRDRLDQLGFAVKDTRFGVEWERKSD